MSITDELREWVECNTDRSFAYASNPPKHDVRGFAEHVLAIADRIDAEHERQMADAFETRNSDENLESDGWARLPRDADGKYIRVGDVLDGYGKTIEVVELRIGRSGWVIISRDGNGYADTFAFTHHHTPTVEDVLEELLREYDRDDSELTNGEIVERFAAKLRLADE